MAGPYKMKNSALHMGAKHRTPIQANYGSPVKEMDPMHNGKPGIQKEDFKQFSNSPANAYGSPHKMSAGAAAGQGATIAAMSKVAGEMKKDKKE